MSSLSVYSNFDGFWVSKSYFGSDVLIEGRLGFFIDGNHPEIRLHGYLRDTFLGSLVTVLVMIGLASSTLISPVTYGYDSK